jgi:AraC-like DNA-binding protein
VSRQVEDLNRRLLRARDAMDRAYAEPLDIRAVAAVAYVSEAHFIRTFRAVFGETPHRYLQRRRVERSMFLLRETDRSVTDICLDVGFTAWEPSAARSGRSSARRRRTTAWGMGQWLRPTVSRRRPRGPWRRLGRCGRGIGPAIEQFWRSPGGDFSIA